MVVVAVNLPQHGRTLNITMLDVHMRVMSMQQQARKDEEEPHLQRIAEKDVWSGASMNWGKQITMLQQ